MPVFPSQWVKMIFCFSTVHSGVLGMTFDVLHELLSYSSCCKSSHFDEFMPARLNLSLHGTEQYILISKFTYILFCFARGTLWIM